MASNAQRRDQRVEFGSRRARAFFPSYNVDVALNHEGQTRERWCVTVWLTKDRYLSMTGEDLDDVLARLNQQIRKEQP